jgi:short subunit dehydrogenase-like uncharacterized protein
VSVPPRQRKLDLLLWGATGFTGRLVAESLTRTYGIGRELQWALGGRSRAKLEGVRSALESLDPKAGELPILVGDSSDRASLDPLARDARVVASTVGPYALHGAELVAACVDAATDYCDLTGEVPFIRDMIDRHHARARETGARIVHACGFDSIPSDLGTLFLQDRARALLGAPCGVVKCFVTAMRGGFSGGTVSSMVHVAEAASHDARIRRALADPYSLDPDRGSRGPDRGDSLGVRFDTDLGRWTGPFVMAAINTRVVRRTNALLSYAYGRDFRYTEAMGFTGGPRGLLAATAASAGIVGAFGALAVPPVRKLVARRFGAPGSGPSRESRDAGFFAMKLLGSEADGERPKLQATVKGRGDPGYSATSRMLAEAAACLALDGRVGQAGGVLTPGAAMGMRLVERLGRVGVDFAIETGAA